MFSNLGVVKNILSDTQIQILDCNSNLITITATSEFVELIQDEYKKDTIYIKFDTDKLISIEEFEEE